MSFSNNIEFLNCYDEDNFVGLKYKKDKVYIYLPLGYDKSYFYDNEIDYIELKTRIMLLLRSIATTKSIDSSKTEFGDENGENKEIPFNSFLWLINDYLNNGLFQEIEKRYEQKSHGKINWKKTLNSEHYFSDNNVVFINPYYENNYQKNNLITELNNYCVKQSIEYIGFLFGNITTPECMINFNNIKENKKYYLNIINKEVSKSFNDRKKLLLNHMKRVIDMSYNDEFENQKTFGTNRYEYVWEYMVNNTLGNVNDISKFFPNAMWNIITNPKPVMDVSKLRPDTVLKAGEKVYILDAKYYKYGVTGKMGDLPHTDSIQKQITYGDHVGNHEEIFGIEKSNIFNAFILPFCKDKSPFTTKNNIEYLGFANSNWRGVKDRSPFEKVALILFDTKYLLDCHYKVEKLEIEQLINSIEKVLKK